ncbi:uncharacterized protein LOC117115294 [Anneissia japonica]|uniref:uncharacterized protein LOC117115294 n=1 Tax=Anneissia japonica TaxID=1529436 RepID=UPI0014257317|nr:uncharacterized protein LOC117115294 [Anneissia japonica]
MTAATVLQKKRSARTVRHYLCSYKKFIDYLSIYKNKYKVSSPDLHRAATVLRVLSMSLTRKVQGEKMKKREEITDDLIPVEDQQRYLTLSKPEIKQISDIIHDGHSPTEYQKSYLRNYIITSLAIENSCRAGVIENLSIKEYKKRTKIDGGDNKDLQQPRT